MPQYTLNIIAYGAVKWQQIADDVINVAKITNFMLKHSDDGVLSDQYMPVFEELSESCAPAMRNMKSHSLLYYNQGYETVSAAIEALPREVKTKLKTFAKSFADIVNSKQGEFKNWDDFEPEEKIKLIQEAVSEFLVKHKKPYPVEVVYDPEVVDQSNSSGKTIHMGKIHLDDTPENAFKTAVHELWHSCILQDTNLETIADNLKSPAAVVLAIDALNIGYISHESSIDIHDTDELYRLQISELLAKACESYFSTSLRELSRKGKGRGRGGDISEEN